MSHQLKRAAQQLLTPKRGAKLGVEAAICSLPASTTSISSPPILLLCHSSPLPVAFAQPTASPQRRIHDCATHVIVATTPLRPSSRSADRLRSGSELMRERGGRKLVGSPVARCRGQRHARGACTPTTG